MSKKDISIGVSISGHDDALIREYVRLCKVEIGGVARIEDMGTHLRMYDPVLLPQEVDAGSVTLNAPAVQAWIQSWLGDAYNDPLPYANMALWHSHHDMSVYFSPQDRTWISNFVNRGWLVSVVYNRKGEYKVRVDTIAGAQTEDLGVWVELEGRYTVQHAAYAVEEAAKAQYEAHVTHKPTSVCKFITSEEFFNYGRRQNADIPAFPAGKRSFSADMMTNVNAILARTEHKGVRNRVNIRFLKTGSSATVEVGTLIIGRLSDAHAAAQLAKALFGVPEAYGKTLWGSGLILRGYHKKGWAIYGLGGQMLLNSKTPMPPAALPALTVQDGLKVELV